MLATSFLNVVVVTLGTAAIEYLLDCWYAKQWLKINKPAVIYISAAVLIGVFGEVFVETIYNALFGKPLWYYQHLPVHNAYTSMYSIVLWAMYGLYTGYKLHLIKSTRV